MFRIFVFALLICTLQLHAQVTPANGDSLNYRIIGCSFPAGDKNSTYTVEVAKGNFDVDVAFNTSIIVSKAGLKTNRVIIEVPAWATAYTWHVIYRGGTKKKSELYHFSTMAAPGTDSAGVRLRITTPAAGAADNYVFVDGSKTLFDMQGNAVWYLPAKIDSQHNIGQVRDLRYSQAGTVTFTSSGRLYEVDSRGHILWQKLPGDAGDSPRSRAGKAGRGAGLEFARLANGSYQTLSFENTDWPLPAQAAAVAKKHRNLNTDSTGATTQRILTAKLSLEDSKHNVLWSWHSSDYLQHSDLYHMRDEHGMFAIEDGQENAAWFDERRSAFYLSFRNLNRIIRIQYPSGEVSAEYGTRYDSAAKNDLQNDLFCGQHCIRRSREGHLYLYNNNSCNRRTGLPSIVMLRDTLAADGSMIKVWEYECAIPGLVREKQLKLNFESGGSVQELTDGSILCCMGGTYSPVFIVSRDKKILWHTISERWNAYEHHWKPDASYRASLISRQELEDMIWHGVPQP